MVRAAAKVGGGCRGSSRRSRSCAVGRHSARSRETRVPPSKFGRHTGSRSSTVPTVAKAQAMGTEAATVVAAEVSVEVVVAAEVVVEAMDNNQNSTWIRGCGRRREAAQSYWCRSSVLSCLDRTSRNTNTH